MGKLGYLREGILTLMLNIQLKHVLYIGKSLRNVW